MSSPAQDDAPRAGRARLLRRRGSRQEGESYLLDPAVLGEHIDVLYRAAWAMCGSPHDAEDLVQTTFARVLRRPRMIRAANERAYLLSALRNVHATSYRAQSRRPVISTLPEDDQLPAGEREETIGARELMQAIATAPPLYRDALIAIDLLGLSYREAARAFRTQEKTIATRLHRARKHIVAELSAEPGLPVARRS
jgi:RNA polymerase sigma-70 factor (ECF subfamily)